MKFFWVFKAKKLEKIGIARVVDGASFRAAQNLLSHRMLHSAVRQQRRRHLRQLSQGQFSTAHKQLVGRAHAMLARNTTNMRSVACGHQTPDIIIIVDLWKTLSEQRQHNNSL